MPPTNPGRGHAGGRPNPPRPAPTPGNAVALLRALRPILRGVDAELGVWTARAEGIPDPQLRRQALASLHYKRFHCEGGSVLAAAAAAPARLTVARALVALQTISDYLDNLSDRSPAGGEPDLARLHLAFTDALAASRPPAAAGDYYALHPSGADGGYLNALVAACRTELAGLPAWRVAEGPALVLAERYCTLQRLKHLQPSERGERVHGWATSLPAPGLRWYEAAAACGSTLGMFALMAAATDPGLTPAAAATLAGAYFPWVCGLHILLDYLIDLQEDRVGGDFNFVAHYPTRAQARERLAAIQAGARRAVAGLPHAAFHRLVVAGLPAAYLSDAKVAEQGLQTVARPLLRGSGATGWLFYGAMVVPGSRRRRGQTEAQPAPDA